MLSIFDKTNTDDKNSLLFIYSNMNNTIFPNSKQLKAESTKIVKHRIVFIFSYNPELFYQELVPWSYLLFHFVQCSYFDRSVAIS